MKSVVLEEEALLLAKRASKLKTAGHVLAVVGIAIDTGSAIHDDYNNGAGWILTITDTGATLGSDVLVTVAPGAVGATDLVLVVALITGLLHNGLGRPKHDCSGYCLILWRWTNELQDCRRHRKNVHQVCCDTLSLGCRGVDQRRTANPGRKILVS